MSSKKIKVVVRTRPTDRFASDLLLLDHDEKSIHIHIPKRAALAYVNHQQEDWSFRFGKILHNASQTTVYRECAQEIVNQVFEGFSGTIMAYGQTGSGKTFTVTGATDVYEQRGMIPRAISQIFQNVANNPDMSIDVRVSYLEIYNEQLRDLLVSDDSAKADLQVIDNSGRSPSVKNLTVRNVFSEEQALGLLFEGETNRTIAEHALNSRSSRSHCIFTILVESMSKVESHAFTKIAKLQFVDLAGSERVAKSQADGATLREAAYINRSLSFLEQVVMATADRKRDHVPYRQSKLTHLLKDSIGGNVNALLVANIWGEPEEIEETVSTLRFAQKISCIDNVPLVNVREDSDTLVKKYQDEIQRLQKELALHDILANRRAIVYDVYSAPKRQEVSAQIRRYIDGSLDELPIESLRHVSEMFAIFRTFVREAETKAAVLSTTIKSMQATKTEPSNEVSQARTVDFRPKDSSVSLGVLENDGFSMGVAPADAKPLISAQKRKAKQEEKLPPLVQSEPITVSTTSILSTAPAPNQSEKPDTSWILNFSRLSVSQVFEAYKDNPGSELCDIIAENKAVLRHKKQEARSLAVEINLTKHIIDHHLEEMKSRCSYFNDDLGQMEGQVLDQDVYEMLLETKKQKKKYRELLEELQSSNREVARCGQLLKECRSRLVDEFRQWYSAVGGDMADLDNLDLDPPVRETMSAAPALTTSADPHAQLFYGARASVARRTSAMPSTRRLSTAMPMRKKAGK